MRKGKEITLSDLAAIWARLDRDARRRAWSKAGYVPSRRDILEFAVIQPQASIEEAAQSLDLPVALVQRTIRSLHRGIVWRCRT